MDCGEFLRGLSDFRDGMVRDQSQAVRFENHRMGCPHCARLLTALDVGLETLRGQDEPVPSPGFRSALDGRLRAEVAIGDPVMPTHAGLAAAFLMVAALGLLLYQGMSRGAPEAAGTAPPAPAMAGRFPAPEPRLPALQDVTLPPFVNSALEYSGRQAPLGAFASLTD
jgi:hypothetical protein